jgi:hypothetical protein
MPEPIRCNPIRADGIARDDRISGVLQERRPLQKFERLPVLVEKRRALRERVPKIVHGPPFLTSE